MRDRSVTRARRVDARATAVVAVNEAAFDGGNDLRRDGGRADGRGDGAIRADGDLEVLELAIADLLRQRGVALPTHVVHEAVDDDLLQK